jgi:hypothetical protein
MAGNGMPRKMGNSILKDMGIDVDPQPSLIEVDGLLAHTGKLPTGYDWDSLVDQDREDRIRDLIER